MTYPITCCLSGGLMRRPWISEEIVKSKTYGNDNVGLLLYEGI